jgi:hypothetical protein
MSRILMIAALLVPLAGCMTIRPLGPMKGVFPEPKAEEIAAEPVVRQPPKPTPPAMLVTPGEVTEANAQAVVSKLKQELEQDRRSVETFPKTSEVSFVKGRQ